MTPFLLNNPAMTPTARFYIKRASFFLLAFWLLVGGCARQFRRPPARPRARVPEIRVALSENSHQGALAFRGKFTLKSEEATYLLDKSAGTLRLRFDGKRLVLFNPKRRFEFTDFTTVRIVPVGKASFVWQGAAYQGEIQFVRDGNGLAVVNKLPLPRYLQGVVPREIPSHTRDYLPAIEAQAVAARSYAFYYLNHPQSPQFDLYADVRHQVYRGTDGHVALSDKAIRETRGLILVDRQGEPVRSEFHSTCGGFLESGSGWLADSSSDSYNCEVSPLYRWVRQTDDRQILKNLRAMDKISEEKYRQLLEEGFEMRIGIRRRSAAGRVQEMMIRVADLSIPLNGWQIRQALADDDSGPLPSTLFFMKKSRQATRRFYLIGAGFGHGRGLCQWGAIGQALKGKSYRDILKFYYPEFQLKKVYF